MRPYIYEAQLRFFGSTFLLILATYAWIMTHLTKSGKESGRYRDGMHNYAILEENDQEEGFGNRSAALSPYKLYSRKLLWIRQILSAVLIVATIYYSIGRFLDFNYSFDYICDCVGYAFLVLSLFFSICIDGEVNLESKYRKGLWLIFYVLVTVLYGLIYCLSGFVGNLVNLLIASTLSIVATICYFVDRYHLQIKRPTAEYTSNLLSYISFNYLTSILIVPSMKKESLEFTDVPSLSDKDSAEILWGKLTMFLNKHLATIRLASTLLTLVRNEALEMSAFQFLSFSSSYIAPLALQNVLNYVSSYSNGNPDSKGYSTAGAVIPMNIWLATGLLFLGPVLKSVGDGQTFVRGR